MGQAEVIKFLERCIEPVSRKQIADAMQEDAIKISKALASLLKWGDVDFIEYTGEEVKAIAGYSPGRRTRFFFIKGKIKN